MRKKKDEQTPEQKFISWLKRRVRQLEMAKQHYEHNPNLMRNIKMANIEIIQSDIASLRELLDRILFPAK